MKLNIGGKIAELRKANNVTQEQLAKAMGVSTAAVSKWESSSTYPDITVLPELSSFFNISIDALLDYKVESNNLEDYRYKLKELVKVSDYITGIPIAEEALKKYPNDFDLLTSIAALMLNAATETDPAKREITRKAIDYYYRALNVMPPGTTTKRETIEQVIASAYSSIGEYEKAISIFEGININGCFNADIAYNMLQNGNVHEAKSRLQSYLWHIAFGFGMIAYTLRECLKAENNMRYVIDIQKLYLSFLQSFTHDKPNYCDLLLSIAFKDLANYQMEVGDAEGMWKSIEDCVYHAFRFDQDPSYEVASVKFMEGSKDWVGNNSSQNACHYIIECLEVEFVKFENDIRMVEFKDKLKASAKDKREIGLWK